MAERTDFSPQAQTLLAYREAIAANNSQAAQAAALRFLEQTKRQIHAALRKFRLSPQDLDDVVQDALLQFWEAQETVRLNGNVSGFLTRIAINRALDLLRWKKRQDAAVDGRVDVADAVPTDDGDAAKAMHGRIWMNECEDQLDETNRSILVLHFYDGRTAKEIAALLKEPIRKTKSRIARIARILRKKQEKK